MNLSEFIKSPFTNGWIKEPGLEYYVKKWAVLPDVIILSSVHSIDDPEETPSVPGAYWRFLKRYSSKVPFTAEQVLNKRLAELLEQQHWSGFGMCGCAAYASPLTMHLYGDHKCLARYGSDEKPSSYIW